jgi:hypothetical protein
MACRQDGVKDMIAVTFGPFPLEPDVFDRMHSPAAHAHHESGHACIARALSLEVTKLDLTICRVRGRRDNPIARWSQAVTALAGPAAERRYVDLPHGAAMKLKGSAWKTDYQNAEYWLGLISGVTLQQVERMAAHLVYEHWAAVERVAAALAEEGELSALALDRLWRSDPHVVNYP